MDPITLIASLLLGLESVGCILATVYFRRWYAAHGQDDPYLKRLRNRNTRIAVGAGILTAVIVYSLVRFALPELAIPPLIPPLGALLIALVLSWLQWGPIADALTIHNEATQDE